MNIHAQLSDLIKEHVPAEQTGAFFNTILQVTCSFWQEMDNMASNRSSFQARLFPTYGVPAGDYWKDCHSWTSQLLGQLACLIGGVGYCCTCSPECAGFGKDSDKVQSSCFWSSERNSGLREITANDQTSHQEVFE